MTDLASLGIRIDSSQVKTGVSDLDKLTAAGARAEAATGGLAGGIKGAGVQAAAMATAAQASARAAMDQAAGFKASASAARVNTLAMRETLVVARELSRGNFTRIPGSLTLLAQGIGSQGGFSSFASALSQQLGLIKKVQDAELAEQAVAAANAAAAVQGAAEKAAANVIAADTEIALAEAQVRVTAGTSAEAAAQVRLAEAHDAVAVAAAEAAVAEDALAVAQGRANEAAALSGARTRTLIGGTGVGLLGVATVAGLAYVAIKQFQDQIKDEGTLTTFRDNLGLTHAEMLKLSDGTTNVSKNIKELTDVAPTFGDVMTGVWQAVSSEIQAGAKTTGDSLQQMGADTATSWEIAMGEILSNWIGTSNDMETTSASTFSHILTFWNQFSAALSAGFWSLADVARLAFRGVGQVISDALHGNVGQAASELGGAVTALMPGMGIAGIGLTAGGVKGVNGLQAQADANMKAALAQNAAAAKAIRDGAIDSAEDRMRKQRDALLADRRPKKEPKPKRNPADDELAKLDAQIAGQNALTQAYLTSDAAVIKAEADEKAMVLAVEKHANAAQTAALKSKELALAIATTSAEGAKEINNLTFEATTRKQVNDMVAAGLIPASQANEYMQLEAKLRPLIAAQSLAEGKAKDKLTDEITKLTKAYADNQAQISRGKALQDIAANDNEADRLKLEATLLGASNRERAVAIAQLEAMQQLRDLPGLSPQEQQDFIQSAINKAQAGIQTPFQQWAATIPQTAERISDAFAEIQTHGLDTFAQGITDVITGTKSLGSAFKDVARSIIGDIIQMTVRMLVFRAISSAFSGLFGGGSPGDLAVTLPTATPVASLPGFDSGGSFSIGGNPGVDQNILSINGQPRARVGNDETLAVIPRGAANSNSRGPIEVSITLVADAGIDARIEDVSARQIGQAAPAIVKASVQQTMRVAGRPKLMGR